MDDLFSKLGINESSDIEMHKNILLSLSEFIHIEGNHIKKKKIPFELLDNSSNFCSTPSTASIEDYQNDCLLWCKQEYIQASMFYSI